MNPTVTAAYLAGKLAAEKAYGVEQTVNVPPPAWAQDWLNAPSKTKKSVTVPSTKKER